MPWTTAALRITESSWRVCALVSSWHGRIRWVAPSLPFVMLCGRRFCAGRPVGPGAVARHFFESGVCPEDPEQVPASAWIDGCGPEVRIREHSVANREHGAVMTIATAWITAHRELTIVDITVAQSSDAEFHRVTIVVFYRDPRMVR